MYVPLFYIVGLYTKYLDMWCEENGEGGPGFVEAGIGAEIVGNTSSGRTLNFTMISLATQEDHWGARGPGEMHRVDRTKAWGSSYRRCGVGTGARICDNLATLQHRRKRSRLQFALPRGFFWYVKTLFL